MDNPIRILILEDDLRDLELIKRELKKADLNVEIEHCMLEQEFTRLLSSFKPNLILSDHNLPSFNSQQAIEIARRDFEDIPFIIVSGFIGEEEAVRLIVEEKVDDYVLKDNLLRLNPSIIRALSTFKIKQELKQKEFALNRLSMVATHTHSGVIITNEKKEIVWVNKAFLKMCEYKEKEVIGKNPGHFLQGPKTDDETVKAVRDKLSRNLPVKTNILNYTKTGREYWIQLDIIPIFEQGKLVNFIGIQEDITDRLNNSRRIEESEKLLQSITNNVPGMVLRYLLHPDGTESVKYVSDGVKYLYDISPEEALNNHSLLWEPILPEDVKGAKDSIMYSAKHLTTWNHTWRINTKTGIKWLQGAGTPLKNEDGTTEWSSLILDVTKEKQYETEIQEMNSRLMEAQHIAHLGDFMIDFEKDITYVSPVIKEIHEVDPEYGFDIEKGLSFFKEGYDRDRKRKVIEEAIKNGTPYNEELQIITAKGNTRWVRSRGQTEFKDGKCSKLYGTLMDITAETELKKSIESSLKEKEFLLAEIHHRVKNNLAIVSGLLELQSFETNDDRTKVILDETARRIKSIAGVHELLYNSDSFSDIPFKLYVQKLTKAINKVVNSKEVDIKVNIQENITLNINQAVPLGLLLNELLTNSFKYAFDQANADPKVQIDFKCENENYWFCYCDNGPGFDKQNIENPKYLGYTLIKTTLNQLGAKPSFVTEGKFELHFKFKPTNSGAHSRL